MEKINLDLFADYLLSTFGVATATGLSAMVDGQLSHDQVTRFLSAQDDTSKDLWLKVKSAVRSVESEDGVVIFDDSILFQSKQQCKAGSRDLRKQSFWFAASLKTKTAAPGYCIWPLKSNASLAKSPTRTLRTQSNHVFMAIYATFKLECLSIANKLNPFALCRKLLINASRAAYAQLRVFQAAA